MDYKTIVKASVATVRDIRNAVSLPIDGCWPLQEDVERDTALAVQVYCAMLVSSAVEEQAEQLHGDLIDVVSAVHKAAR